MTEETKEQWIRIGIIALITFVVSYLAFFIAIKHHLRELNNPYYQVQNLEKIIEKQERDFKHFTEKDMYNPFEPKIRPMIVNLVKEPNEYKVIIDLAQLNGNESAIDVLVNNDELTIKGGMDKKTRGSEKIINFTQTYYLDEKINQNNIKKERKGEKYIISIPFETKEIENDD